MDDVVPHFEITKLGDRLPRLKPAPFAAHIVATKHLPLAENGQLFVVGREARLQSPDGNAQVKGIFARPVTLFFEQFEEAAALAGVHTKQLDGIPLKLPVLQLFPEVPAVSGPSRNGLHGHFESGGLVDVAVADLGDVDLLELRDLLTGRIPR